MPRRPQRPRAATQPSDRDALRASELRIIGGTLRGRRVKYSGRFATRPMKDRVREAVFNLLGPPVVGSCGVDLFAGTGALGLEALSRGATAAWFIEQHTPTARVLRENIDSLDVGPRTHVAETSAFVWARRDCGELPTDAPWIVFCSPPYAYYQEQWPDMRALLTTLIERAPAGSAIVVEADDRFDPCLLPAADAWRVRRYPPAVIAIWREDK